MYSLFPLRSAGPKNCPKCCLAEPLQARTSEVVVSHRRIVNKSGSDDREPDRSSFGNSSIKGCSIGKNERRSMLGKHTSLHSASSKMSDQLEEAFSKLATKVNISCSSVLNKELTVLRSTIVTTYFPRSCKREAGHDRRHRPRQGQLALIHGP